MGKYYHNGNQIFLPLAIQVNHRVCDGYHLGLFVNHLQNYLLNHWE
ncbi:CatA-like O-acetyltransferase [Helicobacter sp.]